MIPTEPATRIYLPLGTTDLRKGLEGLSDFVTHQFELREGKEAPVRYLVGTPKGRLARYEVDWGSPTAGSRWRTIHCRRATEI